MRIDSFRNIVFTPGVFKIRGFNSAWLAPGCPEIEGQLFMPHAWLDDEHAKRAAWGVPTELKAQTKPGIGLELLKRAVQHSSLPFQWVAANELYGDAPAFRDGVTVLAQFKILTGLWAMTGSPVLCSE